MQKNALHNNADTPTILPELMTYPDIARALKIPLGTLHNRLHKYNKEAQAQGWALIEPSETTGKHLKHLYRRERLPEFKAMLQAITATRKPGRPIKSKK